MSDIKNEFNAPIYQFNQGDNNTNTISINNAEIAIQQLKSYKEKSATEEEKAIVVELISAVESKNEHNIKNIVKKAASIGFNLLQVGSAVATIIQPFLSH